MYMTGGTASHPIPAVTTASKGSKAYQVHTYPTKVPPGAIEPFIEASTRPGGVVLDPFCGSGMTGLAAQNIGRRAILSDLAPGAIHLAFNHTHAIDRAILGASLLEISKRLAPLEQFLYESACPTCGRAGLLRHMIWSDVHACGSCGHEMRVWDHADTAGGSSRILTCENCGNRQSRAGVAGAKNTPVERTVACVDCKKLQRGNVSTADLARIARVNSQKLKLWIPSVALGPDREMYRRSALHLREISNVADFWTHRSKIALSELWNFISTRSDPRAQSALQFAFTNTAWHATRMRRYNARGGQRPLTGTLYIPQLIAEGNVFEIFRHQVAQLMRFYQSHPHIADPTLLTYTRQSSANELDWLPNSSIDYVFTDPPFGANLFYADCNVVWESWLGDVTDLEKEIVVNRSLPESAGGKNMLDYENLLTSSFAEIRRVMAPEARASVVFHNSDDKVWSALLSATTRAGLVQTDVSVLNKVQRSMKGYKGRSGSELVPFYDLVITYQAGRRESTVPVDGVLSAAMRTVAAHLKHVSPVLSEETSHERSLEYLYSLSIGSLIAGDHSPKGLSFKAMELALRENFVCEGGLYYAVD
nr:DNA methyltransferase [Diaminobutyricibacter tongyongensis]